MSQMILNDLEIIKNSIRDVPDFPKPGIIFKDISTLVSNPKAFGKCTEIFLERYINQKIDFIACIESRGFLFAAPLAHEMKCGVTLIRKPGKLPAKTFTQSYDLEYGTDILCIHEDAFSHCNSSKPRVLIIDDLLATGGSAGAAIELIRKLGGEVVEAAFVVELDFLNGRKKLADKNAEVFSLVQY